MELPKCKFGPLCYRKNAEHLREFWHPESLSNDSSDVLKEKRHEESLVKDEARSPRPVQASAFYSGSATRVVDEEVKGLPEQIEPKEVNSNQFAGRLSTSAAAKTVDGLILLLLVGPPGSGKSTFCGKLMRSAAQPWTRICQDIIAKGKPGTRQNCLRHAQDALAKQHCVVIDRCNIDISQRVEFLELATRCGAQAHAVVLNLPASVCIERASKRVGHEGGVGVGNAGPVIRSFLRDRQLPSLTEGFSRITFCRTDDDVEKAVQQYGDLFPGQTLESGVFGDTNRKKPLDQSGSKGNNGQQFQIGTGVSHEARSGAARGYEQMPAVFSSSRSGSSDIGAVSSSLGVEDEGANTLVFPSISTLDFQFDHERASGVMLDAVSEFLLRSENLKLRLVLVDLTSDSHILALVRRKALERGLDSLRFRTFVGDITKLKTSGGPACNVIANAANWRLKPGGGGINYAIYKAAGPELDVATKEVAQTLLPGKSVAVRLPVSSPLYKKEGVTHVIHVLGPNMNPQRPNCLAGNYTEGCRILHNAYTSLFQSFSSLTTVPSRSVGIADNGKSLQKPVPKNAFTVLMQASKRKHEDRESTSELDKVTERAVAGEGKDTRVYPEKSPGPWKSKLQAQHEDRASTPKLDKGSERAVIGEGKSTGAYPQESPGPWKSKLQAQPSPSACEMSTGAKTPETQAQEKDTDVEKQWLNLGQRSGHEAVVKTKREWDQWSTALHKTAMHPEQHKDIVLEITDKAVVVNDLYPKATKHVLVVARKPGLDSIDDVQREHLPILQHMHSVGDKWAASFLKEDPSLAIRIGYHSVPSMRQLHLHVISQDFNSPALKNKKHWNSFTTSFFRDSLDVLYQLEGEGRLQISTKNAEDLIQKMELRCHRCKSVHPNMPRLKQHISKCERSLPSSPYLITSDSRGT